MSQKKVYFSGLNALRFFAALAVLFSHVELIKRHVGLRGSLWLDPSKHFDEWPLVHVLRGEVHWLSPLFADLGAYGVVFFFVLSGFLITYLLLLEKDTPNGINIRHFYFRRILRIWPLYLFVVLLGFFVLPHFSLFDVGYQSAQLGDHFWSNFLLYLFMMPNLAISIYHHVPNIGQAWSIGVEEQFYIIWPLLVRYAKVPLKLILGFLFVFLGIKVVVLMLPHFMEVGPTHAIIKTFLAATKMECMAIGALGALLIKSDKEHLKSLVLKNWILITSLVAVVACFYLNHPLIQNGMHLITSVLFLFIILNVSCNAKSVLKLENKAFSFLGRISYGIYMYHMMICAFVINLTKRFYKTLEFSLGQNILVYLSITGLTILISYLSYEFLEKPFLRKKAEFQKIKSSS